MDRPAESFGKFEVKLSTGLLIFGGGSLESETHAAIPTAFQPLLPVDTFLAFFVMGIWHSIDCFHDDGNTSEKERT